MTGQNTLYLYEEIMLLALRDEEGTIEPGTMYQYAIGGAILAELFLHERIGVDESGKRQLVNVLSDVHIGDPLIDECHDRIRTAKRRAALSTWVSRFASSRNLKHRIAQRLCERGILRAEDDQVLLIFSRKIYPEVDPEPERQLVGRMRDALFTDAGGIDPRTVVLISLANSADLLKGVIDKKELKGRKERIKRIVNGEMTGAAAKEAIAAVQTAVMIAAIMPALVTTTAATG